MENASKALIIAGAILLAIAIIGIGMYVFSSASSQVSDTDLSAEELAVFNGPFERYEGTQTGSSVKSLLRAVRAQNSASGTSITVNDSPDIAGAIAALKDSDQKTVSFDYGDDGRISNVKY